jgi:hypothetical protein
MLDGRFALFAAAIAATPQMAAQGHADAVALVDALASYSSGRDYLNFAESPVDVSASYPAETWRRLTGIRSAVDPSGVLRANHPVARLYETVSPAG